MIPDLGKDNYRQPWKLRDLLHTGRLAMKHARGATSLTVGDHPECGLVINIAMERYRQSKVAGNCERETGIREEPASSSSSSWNERTRRSGSQGPHSISRKCTSKTLDSIRAGPLEINKFDLKRGERRSPHSLSIVFHTL